MDKIYHPQTNKVYIGLQFKHYAKKSSNPYTVIDFHTTYNLKNEVVSVSIICSQECIGQTVISEQPMNTILRSL